ncbi:secretory subunit [Tulasnella sp. 403]|nr:secretory subunit [Tulasnella sp. 403]
MANYQYDESGVLASYFALTFLSLILIPLTLSLIPSGRSIQKLESCGCAQCQQKESRLRKSRARSILKPQMGTKSLLTIAGWAVFAFLVYKVATTEVENKIYDPFEILGIRSGATEKEIKKHYKKLSLKFHPDKAKLVVNQTMEEVASHFVDLTKAYKALTDEEIRNNLEKYGHPDGKQEFSMGLALPTWVVASQNNIWILGCYGLLFAGLLPVFVGRWWFGSRKYTKDGVLADTAQMLFKNIQEETTTRELIPLLAQLDQLLPATQNYLNSMLAMTLAHNWLNATVNVMNLHAHIAQATLPDRGEVKAIKGGVTAYLKSLEAKQDPRLEMFKRVADNWGSLQVVESQFKGMSATTRARVVTPGAIVQLVCKLRLTPPTQLPYEDPVRPEPTPEERKKEVIAEEAKESAFLQNKDDAGELEPGLKTPGYAHAPHWPLHRKPTWWIMVGDQKMNKVIVPPIRISDIPFANPSKAPNDYRLFKLQFQAPPQIGVYTFQLVFVSDTFVGEDVRTFLPLKVEDLPADAESEEDEISEPDEDTFAGQMAVLRGEKVKRSPYHDDDDSSTDDDISEGDTDSDSDSD